MKNIIVTALFLLLSTNAFACYDESLSDRANFDNCLVEAEQGHAKAQYNLGVMYRHGRGLTQGVTQFEGYATAKEIARNYKEASKWYRKAAEQGNEDAQYNLGVMYSEGKGVARDHKEAVKWYRKAAEQGNEDAQYNLGVMYGEGKGKGVIQDYKEAVKWYGRAAEQGVAIAQLNLGVMYEHGQGVTQDQKIAHMWFNIAAANEIPRAAELRDIMAQEMTPSQIEKAQDMAREWMAEHD